MVRNVAVTVNGEGEDQTIHIRNEYSSPATAWILQCETPQGGSRHYWNDQELSFQTASITPGQEIAFKFPKMAPAMRQQMANSGTCSDFHAIAAVFNDGTVSGDLAWINGVVADRRQAYQDIAKATDILNTAISKGSIQRPSSSNSRTGKKARCRQECLQGHPPPAVPVGAPSREEPLLRRCDFPAVPYPAWHSGSSAQSHEASRCRQGPDRLARPLGQISGGH